MFECYATLAQARVEVKADIVDVSGDAELLRALYFASARVQVETERHFWPRLETVTYDATGFHIGPYRLDTGRDLLEVTTLTNGDDTAISAAVITLAHGNIWPKYRIRLKRSGGVTFTYTDDYEEAISVAGVWGYHSDYTNAWKASGLTVQGGGLNSSATAVTVSATVAGADSYGITPILSPGNLIKVDSEYMAVIKADGTSVTVRRGANGTTAASHSASAAISVFYPEQAITRAVLRWAAYLYARRGEFSQSTFDGVGVTTFPQDAPAEVQHILDAYRRKAIYVL